MEIFFEIHKDIPREGPGDNESTKKAFEMLNKLPKNPKILDIGCGPGMQTIELAKNTNGFIYALDFNKVFLDRLNKRSKSDHLDNKITSIHGSMFTLEKYFEEKSLDLIWSEGSIFIIGFKQGLKAWRSFLKKDGYLVVSEISWLKDDVSKEIKDYWESDYPNMNNIDENIKLINKSGYRFINHFTIPKSSWFDNYYNPLEKRISNLRKIHKDNDEWTNRLNSTTKEIDMYRKYSDCYGYVFYIMQNNDFKNY